MEHIFRVQRLHRPQNLGLLVADRIRLKRNRRLHGGQAEQLHDVVGDHVAQRARGIKVSAAQFHAHGLRIRDLHMIDIAAVPDGLEDGVVEAEHHDVLHRLFAQVVIDAINLVFRQHRFDVPVQGLRRVQIVPERLFDDHPPPASAGLLGQSRLAQLLNDRGKELWRRGQVEEIVRLSAVFLVYAGELRRQSGIRGRIAEFAAQVVEPIAEPLKFFGAAVPGIQEAGHLVAKLIASQIVEGHTHDRKSLGKQLGFHQVIQGRNQLALGQVTGGAEQNHDARTSYLADLLVLLLPAHCRCRRHVVWGMVIRIAVTRRSIVGQCG